MIQLKRILLPTDFSKNARAAQEYACAFADHFGAELHLLYVLQDMVIGTASPGETVLIPATSTAEAQASAERALAELPDAAWAKGKQIVRATRTGAPLVEIVRYAREQNIDLIVLSTHGRTGLAHVLLGSVAENVVRKAPCPVLTVRPDEHRFVMP